MAEDQVPTPENLAYAQDPFSEGNDKFSMINLCRGFFAFRNLDNAMAYGSGLSNPLFKSDLRRYVGRGM